MVAAYLRVSSASQTARMQRDAIERAASARGHKVVQWYEDKFTGAGAHPDGLVRLLNDARRGEFGRLYVYRLDRLSRRGIRDLLEIVQDLDKACVELVTIADGFDLSGSARDVVLAVLAWAAQMERAAIAERITAARVRVEGEGRSWGRPPRVTPSMLSEAKKLARDGKSIREIAETIRVSRATVSRALLSQKPPQNGVAK